MYCGHWTVYNSVLVKFRNKRFSWPLIFLGFWIYICFFAFIHSFIHYHSPSSTLLFSFFFPQCKIQMKVIQKTFSIQKCELNEFFFLVHTHSGEANNTWKWSLISEKSPMNNEAMPMHTEERERENNKNINGIS